MATFLDYIVVEDILVNIYQVPKVQYLHIRAEIKSNGNNQLHITIGSADTKLFAEFFVRYMKTYFDMMFRDLQLSDSKKVSSDYTSQLDYYREKYRAICPNPNSAALYRLNLKQKKDEPLSVREIEEAVKNSRGELLRRSFVCRLCNVHHTEGYRYYIRNHSACVCRFCTTDIRETEPWKRVILTNMGHGKR